MVEDVNKGVKYLKTLTVARIWELLKYYDEGTTEGTYKLKRSELLELLLDGKQGERSNNKNY